jgi:hypothetical protein
MDPGSWSARVAAVIREEMASQIRTDEDLAGFLGLTEGSLARRLDGAVPFDVVEIERVSAWLGVAPSELLARAHGRVASRISPHPSP